MAQHGIANDAFIYVADSAMVTEENLAQISDSPENLFITRLPANYKECARAIQTAVGANQWVENGAIARTPATKNRPNASYRAHETTVTLYEKSASFIVSATQY
jgi:transposase